MKYRIDKGDWIVSLHPSIESHYSDRKRFIKIHHTEYGKVYWRGSGGFYFNTEKKRGIVK